MKRGLTGLFPHALPVLARWLRKAPSRCLHQGSHYTEPEPRGEPLVTLLLPTLLLGGNFDEVEKGEQCKLIGGC